MGKCLYWHLSIYSWRMSSCKMSIGNCRMSGWRMSNWRMSGHPFSFRSDGSDQNRNPADKFRTFRRFRRFACNFDLRACVRTFRDQITDAQGGMGRQHLFHLGGYRIFSCIRCQTFLTNRDELMSTRFTGSTGRAFLFNKVVNIHYRYSTLLLCDSLQARMMSLSHSCLQLRPLQLSHTLKKL